MMSTSILPIKGYKILLKMERGLIPSGVARKTLVGKIVSHHADFGFSYFVIEYCIENKVRSREADTIFYNEFNIKIGF
ncbi:hypothetical protein KFK09_011598 [Dendrobium nobile]|uniref:Uncharacterized protein n=1 Tax=Dendrobium nobile TaxID=94219 RepID=A0A8T3BD37_DENNO|nr:hypothetical protein KFK09_011598 [Dendrobium nobile]